jgi:hypothetical protein
MHLILIYLARVRHNRVASEYNEHETAYDGWTTGDKSIYENGNKSSTRQHRAHPMRIP